MLYAENFRAPGYTDKQTLDAAIAAWKICGGTLELGENQVYDLGSYSTEQTIYTLSGSGFSGVLEGNGATIKVTTTASPALIRLFDLSNYRGLILRNLKFEDAGFMNTAVRGMIALAPRCGADGSFDLVLDNLSSDKAVALLLVEGSESDLKRVSGIRGSLRAEQTFYVAAFQNNGDDVDLDIVANDCGRVYFPYGVRAHRVKLDILNRTDTPVIQVETCVLIKRTDADIGDIEVDALFRGSIPFWPGGIEPGSCVTFEHQTSEEPSIMDGIRVRVHVEEGTSDPKNVRTFTFRAYTGTTLDTTTTKVWKNISLSGRPAPGTGANIAFLSVPSARTVVTLDPELAVRWHNGQIVAPNIAFRTRIGSEFYIKTGVLGASPGGLPLASVDVFSLKGRPLDVLVTVMAYSNRDATTGRSSYFRRALYSGYVDGSGDYHLDTQNVFHTDIHGTEAFVGVDTGSSDFRVLLYNGGGQFDGNNGLAKVELEWIGQKPADW
jgi:hypothetical protein